MISFKEKQLELIQNLGDVMYFSYDLQRVNRLAKTKQKELVKNAENFYIWQLEQIADNIVNKKSKIVLVAGPSSAGKTTSSFEIKRALKKRGINAHVVSMDDFFVNTILLF